MIITNRFVFIHVGKTGGTFVTKVLKKIHKELPKSSGLVAKIKHIIIMRRSSDWLIDLNGRFEKHGPCRKIPKKYLDRPIAAVVRNPYDHWVSGYFFRWWAEHPQNVIENMDEVIKQFPKFPSVSFPEYIDLANKFFQVAHDPTIKPKKNIGFQTRRFVSFFFKKPDRILNKINENMTYTLDYESDLYPIHFMKNNTLNNDLFKFLVNMGYRKTKVSFILQHERVQPSEGTIRPHYDFMKHYTPELKKMVRAKEDLIFSMFPEFDI